MIGDEVIRIDLSYTTWKTSTSKIARYYEVIASGYRTFGCGSEFVFCTEAIGEDISDYETNIKPSSTQVSSVDEAYAKSLSGNLVPVVTPRDPDGSLRFVDELRSDSRYTVCTHNFADKCSWYQESTRVSDETLTTTDPNRKIFDSAYTFWIDLTHGRVSDEDDISTGKLPVIKVDGTTKTEATPFGDGTDGDFVIDYETGKVIFHASIDQNAVVTASYNYAGSSIFTIVPSQGKVIRLLEAECQMSECIEMNDDLWYGIYVTIPGVGEVLAKQKRYKTIQDIINEANGAYPVIPALGGDVRGTSHNTITFPWHYVSRTDLKSSLSMKIKIKLPNDVACGGHSAFVAFYCVSVTET